MYLKTKRQVHQLLAPGQHESRAAKLFNAFIITLIILNTLSVILETVNSLYLQYHYVFKAFEIFSVTVFSIEYVLRVWSCTSAEEFRHPFYGRIKYIFSFDGLVDLIAILPFYLPLAINIDLRFVRVLRLVRLFRFFKLNRYLHASKILVAVIEEKFEELLIALIVTLSLIVMASCMMYFVEHEAQPDKFASIPETMWWSVATLTTVGYGDMYPITPLGKTLTSFLSILGIGIFALPAGIMASGFSDAMNKHKKEKFCPHCGKEIH